MSSTKIVSHWHCLSPIFYKIMIFLKKHLWPNYFVLFELLFYFNCQDKYAPHQHQHCPTLKMSCTNIVPHQCVYKITWFWNHVFLIKFKTVSEIIHHHNSIKFPRIISVRSRLFPCLHPDPFYLWRSSRRTHNFFHWKKNYFFCMLYCPRLWLSELH